MRRLNVGAGPDIRPAAQGWVNMDIAALPGVDVVHDAFRFPWPFEDGSFDHVLCSHILEHVPHEVGLVPYQDGFIRFVEECHRVLRPGGTLEVLTPHPRSQNTIADPTHTRVVHPANFACFDPDGVYAWRHYTKARLRLVSSAVTAYELSAPDFLPLGPSRIPLMRHLDIRLPFLRRLLHRRPSENRFLLERA